MTWEPLLHGAGRDRAHRIVHDIACAVRTAARPRESRGLMGPTGVAVFLAQAEAEGIGDDLGAGEALERGLGDLSGEQHSGLWTGAAGVRWALARLVDAGDAGELLAHLDRAIEASLPTTENHDLYAGIAGILVAYAPDAEHGDRVVGRVLDHLARFDLAHPTGTEIGCAHGVAGVLGALAGCWVHGRHDPRIPPLMTAIVDALADVDVRDQRIGWCSGEPGIAIALLAAARALDRPDLVERAVAVALAPFERGAGRWPVDGGLCHGAAGLAHLTNRMYQATGDGRLADHARTWLGNLMAMQRPGEGVAGFAMFRRKPAPTWEADPSLLAGAAGVGLALLAGAATHAPDWDALLGAPA